MVYSLLCRSHKRGVIFFNFTPPGGVSYSAPFRHMTCTTKSANSYSHSVSGSTLASVIQVLFVNVFVLRASRKLSGRGRAIWSRVCFSFVVVRFVSVLFGVDARECIILSDPLHF